MGQPMARDFMNTASVFILNAQVMGFCGISYQRNLMASTNRQRSLVQNLEVEFIKKTVY